MAAAGLTRNREDVEKEVFGLREAAVPGWGCFRDLHALTVTPEPEQLFLKLEILQQFYLPVGWILKRAHCSSKAMFQPMLKDVGF